MEYSTENIASAVKQFYCDASLHIEVHHWLTMAQVSQQAWQFSWDLLMPQMGVEVQFFGASCLHVKISRYWHEVPQTEYESLRARLFEKIVAFAAGPKMVLTRLCVSTACLALQTMPDFWCNPTQELISMFQQTQISGLSSEQLCRLLLELLTVIPEEFIVMNLSRHRRGVLRSELHKALQHVMPLLQSVMNPSTPTEVSEQSLRCFSSWVVFGMPLNEAEPLIHRVFEKLSDEAQFETAIDTLVNIFSHGDAIRYSNTIMKLIPFMLNLQPMFIKAVTDADADTCHGFCRLVVSLAENHCKLLTEGLLSDQPQVRHNCLAFINLVLSCTSLPCAYPTDESCSDLTFTFWYTLQDEAVMLDSDKYKLILPYIQQTYYKLIDVLLVKVQFPDDRTYESWTAEEKEQLRCYRQDIGDTMMYTFHILREPVLGHMCKTLTAIRDKQQQEPFIWQQVEAIYFFFGSVMESVDPDECVYLPSLLQLVSQLPMNNVKLVSTALFMIGSLGEWLSGHPDCLSHVIPLLLRGLNNTEVATPATLALKDVTREALDHIQPYCHDIITTSQAAIEKGILKPRECCRLMSAIGQVLSVLPFDQIMAYINLILPSHVNQLTTASTAQPTNTVKMLIINKLSLLSWLFGSLNTSRDDDDDDDDDGHNNANNNRNHKDSPKPVLCILRDIFPIVHTILSRWLSDSGVVEAICDLFKRALVTLLDDFSPLSSVVIEILVQMYQAVQHSAVLDVSKQLMLMFSKNTNLEPCLSSLFTALCDTTIAMLHNNTAANQPDIIEEFMQFLSQVVKKNKQVLTGQGVNLLGLYHVGIVGLSVAEHHTVKHSSIFMSTFVATGAEVTAIKDVVNTNGHVLVERLLRSIGGESPRGVIDYISTVLMSLITHHPAQLNKWLQQFFAVEGFPSMLVTQKDKDLFTKSLLMPRLNCMKVKEFVKEFTLTCRGLIGTEYAASAELDI